MKIQIYETEKLSWEVAMKQAKENSTALLHRTREDLSSAHAKQREKLIEELEQLRCKHLESLKSAKSGGRICCTFCFVWCSGIQNQQ